MEPANVHRHGTFIIGFSIARKHIAVARADSCAHFREDIEEAGFSCTNMLFRIKWTDKVNYNLLHKIVEYNIESKKDMNKFWR